MPTYISLMKLTEQGIKDIKNAPQRMNNNIKAMEAQGIKLVELYAVMGEYDYIAISEAPSDEVGMTFTLALGSQGNVRTTTCRAFKKEQFVELVNKLP